MAQANQKSANQKIAIQKITLSSSRDIPFNKLVLSQANVRRVKAGVSIEELAEDIARRGLLQGLNVRPILDAEGAETGRFEIPAGGRRFRALELLVKRKRLAKTAPVPCVMREVDTPILAEDDSLAENIQRAPLHPLDQFRAFQAMRENGMSEEDIAAAFFVGANVVKQRLRLAAVSLRLLEVYADDGMTLEQLMAFTVSPDHARQEQVWENIKDSWSKEPYHIRRLLTEKTVRASDKRARFIGFDAYEAAGGVVLRDLFEADDGGWLADAALLDRLVAEKLKAEAETIAAEGWKWIEAAVDFPYGHDRGLRRLNGESVDLTPEERATREALRTEYDRLEAEYSEAEELPDAIDARLGEIETALSAFDDRPLTFDPGDMARAGAFVSIGPDGRLIVDRGHIRPQDEAPVDPRGTGTGDAEGPSEDLGEDRGQTGLATADPTGGAQAELGTPPRSAITIAGPSPDLEDEDDAIRPLPERLVSELTAHRTLALRDAVAEHPHVAMTALLHKLVADRFHHAAPGSCFEVSVRQVHFSAQAADLKDSSSARAIAERQDAWMADVPRDEQALWDWLAGLDEASRLALLAHCVSFGVNALYEKPNPYGGSGVSAHGLKIRLTQAERLARATGLDMAQAGWRPTLDTYLGRVTKSRILEAVREGAGERAAGLIAHLKKDEMAKEAERLLANTGWLPEPLRVAGDETASPGNDAPMGGGFDIALSGEPGAALPAFLAEDGDENAPSDEEPSDDEADPLPAVAAE
jgi:ParB family transcriptional regulator, chromosome partitioning protein